MSSDFWYATLDIPRQSVFYWKHFPCIVNTFLLRNSEFSQLLDTSLLQIPLSVRKENILQFYFTQSKFNHYYECLGEPHTVLLFCLLQRITTSCWMRLQCLQTELLQFGTLISSEADSHKPFMGRKFCMGKHLYMRFPTHKLLNSYESCGL